METSSKENTAELLKNIQVWSDKPIPSANFFNFREYSNALATIIQKKDTDTPLTIGVFGDWGSGKTSLMKTIESRLNGLYFIDEFENVEGLDNLAMRLKEADVNDPNPISFYCREQFSPEIKKLLFKTNGTNISGPFRIALVEELNKLIINPQFFNKKAFAKVELTEKTKKLLLKHSLAYEEMINLNRSLLNEAFPDEIAGYLKKKPDSYPVKTIWFNAWKYDKEDVLWRALLMRILQEMKVSTKPIAKDNQKKKIQWLTDKISYYNQRLRNKWYFNIDDIKDLDQLVMTLTDKSNPLSQYLMEKLSPDLKNSLKEYVLIGQFDTLKATLINELNQLIVKNPHIKDQIDQLHLLDTTRELILQDPQGNKLTQLNWLILKQALFSNIINNEIDNYNEEIECLQTRLYQDVYRKELGGIEIKPTKAIKGTIKLGLSAIPTIGKPITEILKEIDNESAFNELLESVQRKKKVDYIEKVQFMEQFQHEYEKIIEKYPHNKRVVIFIDDLDRCIPEKAIEILESIKLFLDVENSIVVLGIDKRVISKSMEVKYKDFLIGENKEIPISGDNYLEKFIQLGFKLPLISDKNIEEYINNLKVPDFYVPFLEMIIKGIENNPRKIKRFFNVIELHRKLAYSLKEITESLSESENIRNRFNALLVEWQIISQHNPEIRKVIEDDPKILSILHEYLKPGEREKIKENLSKVNEKLSEMVIKDTKLMDLIEIFPFDISEGDFIKDVNQVIYLSSFTPAMTDKGEEEGIKIRSMSHTEIEKAIKAKESLMGRNLKEADLNGLNLIKMNLNGADLTRAEIKNAKLIRATLKSSDLTDAQLEGSDLRHTELWSATLIGANLKNVNLQNSVLFNTEMEGADLSGADLTNAGLMSANLKAVNFKGATLYNVNLKNTKFDKRTNFIGAEINSVTIDNLKGSNWNDAIWDPYWREQIEKKYPTQ